MRIYLDACCLNRPFDDQRQARIHLESEAVLWVLTRCQSGEWALVGSEAPQHEINPILDDERRQKVHYLASIGQLTVTIDDATSERAQTLERQGFGPYDALHMACAEAASADVLLTTDDQMLGLARRLVDDVLVQVENPVVFLMEVTADGRRE